MKKFMNRRVYSTGKHASEIKKQLKSANMQHIGIGTVYLLLTQTRARCNFKIAEEKWKFITGQKWTWREDTIRIYYWSKWKRRNYSRYNRYQKCCVRKLWDQLLNMTLLLVKMKEKKLNFRLGPLSRRWTADFWRCSAQGKLTNSYGTLRTGAQQGCVLGQLSTRVCSSYICYLVALIYRAHAALLVFWVVSSVISCQRWPNFLVIMRDLTNTVRKNMRA